MLFNIFRRKPAHSTLFYHTDVHCHLLPGVDHGSPDVPTSLLLLGLEQKMGIDRIIATSHVTQNTFENTPETLRPAHSTLCQAVAQAGMDMRIDLAAEYRIDDFSLSQFKAGQFLTYPGNFLLLENAFQQEILGMDELIFNLQLKHLSPIIAHPERYEYYAHNPSRFSQLHNAGVLFQTNLLSFTGYFGSRAIETAWWLLDNDLIDFLGSDMHHEKHAQTLIDFIGSRDYRRIADRLATRILNDTEIPLEN